MNNLERQHRQGKRIGMLITVALHVLLCTMLGVTGFRLIYPPPEERGILLEIPVEEIVPKPVPVQHHNEPRAPKANPKEEVKLVQKSEAQVVGTKKEGEAPVNEKALFTSTNDTDKGVQETADRVSKALKEGHAQGNTTTGNTNGEPSVQLEGRAMVGSLPKPEYKVNKSGIVVVKIMVDREGNVTNAIAGQPGTTVSDATLWAAAKQAALKARFSPDSKAAITQVGTITYVFTLK